MKKLWLFLPILLATSCLNTKDAALSISDADSSRGLSDTDMQQLNILGAGDEMDIKVWRQSDLNRTVKIDPDGNIYLPLAGDIAAARLTVPELRAAITERLAKYLIDPQVDINVTSLESRKVHILGEVNTPGTFQLDPSMQAWEAIAKSGGFTSDANRKNVLLFRNSQGEAETVVINMNDVLRSGNIDRRMLLRRGDVIYVPPTFIADVERFARRLNNIVSPIIGIETAIVLQPDVADAIKGESKDSNIVIGP